MKDQKCKQHNAQKEKVINSRYLGVAGLPLFPALSEPPILSIQVPQLNSLPPYTNPLSQWIPASTVKPKHD